MNSNEKTKTMQLVGIVLVFLLAISIRVLCLPFTNYDTDGYVRWYNFLVANGRFSALGVDFAVYTPPYLYLLSLASLTEPYLSKILAIKLIPILFDAITSIVLFKIVRLKYPSGNLPFLASGLFLATPTIWMNSALWGQIDSIYTCFLVLCTYFVLKEKAYVAMVAFGVSISIKAQAAFFIPFLLVLAFKKRLPWRSLLMVPMVYFFMMLPAIAAGRPLLDVFLIYLKQANELQIPSFNAPNWYVFVPQSAYAISTPIGFAITLLLGGFWILFSSRSKTPLSPGRVLLLSLVSVAIAPFLLPKMHDRYFYPADVFSIIAAFYYPGMWIVALGYQAISSLAYSIFLFDTNRQIALILSTQLNTYILVYLLWKQIAVYKEGKVRSA